MSVDAPAREPMPLVVQRLAVPLRRAALMLTGDPKVAEDLVRDAFAATWDHYDRFDDPSSEVVARLLGSAQRAQRADDDELLRSLAALPERERTVLALRLGAEFDERTTARLLDLPPADVVVAQRQALARVAADTGGEPEPEIRERLAEEFPGEIELRAELTDVRQRMFQRRRRRVGLIVGGALALLAGAVFFLVTREGGDDGSEAAPTTTEAPTSTVAATTTVGPTTTLAATTTAPATTEPETTAPQQATYEVQPGDGWIPIADKLGVPIELLLQANGATLQTPIVPGQDLVVPTVTTTAG